METHVAVCAATRRRCSQSQKRFWFEEQLQPGNPALNVAVRWRLEGDVSQAHIAEAWRLLVERHEALRTWFENRQGEPLQVIEPEVALHLPVVDLTTLSEAEAFAEADRIALLEAHKPFDVSRAPLVRVTHLRVRENVSVLLVTAHHTVCDGWSVGILAREMGALCADLQAGRPPSLAPLEAAYADYAEWEQDWLADPLALAGERETLKRRLELQTVRTADGQAASRRANGEQRDRDAAARSRRDRRARRAGAPPQLHPVHDRLRGFARALAALQRRRRRRRRDPDRRPRRQRLRRARRHVRQHGSAARRRVRRPDLRRIAPRARDTVSDAFELRHVPLEQVIEIVNPKRDFSRNILFSVNFIFQRSFIKNETYGSFALVDMPSRSAGPIYDLNFFMVERPEGWRASCEYNSDLFERATVESMVARFAALLERLCADPGQRISDVVLTTAPERAALIALGRGVRSEYERDASISQLFSQQARRTPFAAAVLSEADGTLTYTQLDERSNRLARYLRELGVESATRVAVALERSVDVPVALLGILKAVASTFRSMRVIPKLACASCSRMRRPRWS